MVVYDILFGKGVHCGGDLKQFCHQNEAVLQETLKKLQKKNKTGNSLVDDDQLTGMLSFDSRKTPRLSQHISGLKALT